MCKVKKNLTQFDSLGIAVDLTSEAGRKLAEEIVRQTGDEELRNLISIANALNKRYIVAAGCFNGKGIILGVSRIQLLSGIILGLQCSWRIDYVQ